jgi:chromosome segregation ATPase
MMNDNETKKEQSAKSTQENFMQTLSSLETANERLQDKNTGLQHEITSYKSENKKLLEELQIRCNEYHALEEKYENILKQNDYLRDKLSMLTGFVAAVEIIFDGSLYNKLEEYGEWYK